MFEVVTGDVGQKVICRSLKQLTEDSNLPIIWKQLSDTSVQPSESDSTTHTNKFRSRLVNKLEHT